MTALTSTTQIGQQLWNLQFTPKDLAAITWDMFELPTELLWHTWSFLVCEDLLRLSCCSRTCASTVRLFLARVAHMLVVYKDLTDLWLTSLVQKLECVKFLNIVCGQRPADGRNEKAMRITFGAVTNILSSLPPSALVDINQGNCYLGNIKNLVYIYERNPHLLSRLANLHVRSGLPKEVLFRMLCHCSGLRALSLDHCILDCSINTPRGTLGFPHLTHLCLHGVSFAFSGSLATLLAGCGTHLIGFEMSGCIGFRDSDLEGLAGQEKLQLLSLKQQCVLTDNFTQGVRWHELRILTLDSVKPERSIAHIIASSPKLFILEINNIVSDRLFEQLHDRHIINPHFRKLTLCNYVDPQTSSAFSDAGLACLTDAFPNLEFASLHHFQISTLPGSHMLAKLTQINLEYVLYDTREVEKIVANCKSLERLFCISLKPLSQSQNSLRINSNSLQSVCFRDCVIDSFLIEDCPHLKRVTLSHLRNSALDFTIKGPCGNISCLELKKLGVTIVDAVLVGLMKYMLHDPSAESVKWLKTVCSHCAPSLSVLDSIVLKQMRGHVALVTRPSQHKKHHELQEIIGSISAAVKTGIPLARDVTLPPAGIYELALENDIYFKSNFPIEPFVSKSGRSNAMINLGTPIFNRCLMILSNMRRSRIFGPQP